MSAVLDEVEIVLARLNTEENFVSYLYDDATDLPVKAPIGEATIGFGCNVQAGWTRSFAAKVMRLKVLEIQEFFQTYDWYQKCNPARRSVLLDIAFNGGDGDLLKYHMMIAAITKGDWVAAAAQCGTSNPSLKGRYAILSKIMLTGEIGP